MIRETALVATAISVAALIVGAPVLGAYSISVEGDPIGRVKDLLSECTNQTIGDEVGYDIRLNSIDEISVIHHVDHGHPYDARGIFEYRGKIGDFYWYLILSGHSKKSDDCQNAIKDLITESRL